MKFETIKAKAARIYVEALRNWGSNLIPRGGTLSKVSEASFAVLLPKRAVKPPPLGGGGSNGR